MLLARCLEILPMWRPADEFGDPAAAKGPTARLVWMERAAMTISCPVTILFYIANQYIWLKCCVYGWNLGDPSILCSRHADRTACRGQHAIPRALRGASEAIKPALQVTCLLAAFEKQVCGEESSFPAAKPHATGVAVPIPAPWPGRGHRPGSSGVLQRLQDRYDHRV